MSLYTSTSMDGLTPEQKAVTAIRYILRRIADHPEVGYYLGLGTESFALLTEADAALNNNASVEETRRKFRPVRACNPYEAAPEECAGFSMVDLAFVRQMERELLGNQGKGIWSDWKPDRMTCSDEIFHRARKLVRALRYNDKDGVSEHASDLANIAMKTAECHGTV